MDSRKPKSCLGCPLAELGRGFLRPDGKGTNGVLIVGEAAGKHEAAQSLPFRPNAPAGGLLQHLFKLSGFKRDDFTIYNIVACQPPSNELVGAPYEAEAIAHCKQHLDAVVEQAKPSAILALGGSAFKALTANPTANISEGRGYLYNSVYGLPLIPSYHPAFLLRGSEHLLGVAQHDMRRSVQVARSVPQPLPTRYNLSPTDADIRAYLDRLTASDAVAAHDLETENILGRKTEKIIQVQFSSGIGEAVVLQWPRQAEAVKAVFATDKPKWGYNDRLFDRPILKRHDVTLNGELHDLMNVYSHLQPSFVSAKDDTTGDKGVPSRLMSLQSCLSFYHPEFGLWKRPYIPPFEERWMNQPLPLPLRYYGAKDVDASYRVGVRMFQSLRQLGVYEGYDTHKRRLGDVLDEMSAIGVPVDRERQDRLRQHIQSEEAQLELQLQEAIPFELLPVHPKAGYKTDRVRVGGVTYHLNEIMAAEADVGIGQNYIALNGSRYIQQRFELETSEGEAYSELRWCKVLAFNGNSSQQLLRYIKHQGYRVPTHFETGRDTTGRAELESLIEETDDNTLKLVLKLRKLTKLGTVYCSGAWIPSEDGRVHPTFRFGTASGQTSCINPNVQQFPEHYDPNDQWIVDIMQEVKACIRAQPGHIFVKLDAKGAHAKMQGFLAEDLTYMRLASIDLHSYNTAYYLDLPDKDSLLALDDTALAKRLKEIKTLHGYDRDFKLKRVAYLMQFMGGAEKAFKILTAFESVIEVQELINMIKKLFPKTFVDFPAKVEKQLRQHPRIITPHKAVRYFWDSDIQQAVAHSVANPFHCHWQEALIRLYDRGAFQRFEIVNYRHDDIWAHPTEDLVEECIATCREEFEKPSDKLINSLGAFSVGVDAKVGYDMLNLRDV